MKALITIVTLSLLPLLLPAQWQKIYTNPPYDDEGQDVVQLPDGGYLIAGYTNTSKAFDTDVTIIRTDANGEKINYVTAGGDKPDFINRILPAADGSYYFVGYTQSYGGGDMDIFLMNVSASGTVNWQKDIGGNGNEMGMEIIATNDGKYLIVGSVKEPGGNFDMNLRKIEPDGTVIWSQTYGGSSNDYGNSVKMTSDGGFIILGSTESYGTGGDAFLVRANSAGGQDWYKTFGGPNRDEGIYITVSASDSLAFIVRDSTGAGKDIDIHVFKTGLDGGLAKTVVYGGDEKDTPKMITNTSDGGFIIGAISRSWGWFNPDMWIIKTDPQLNAQWISHFGGVSNEHCYTVRELSDGSYIAVGKTHSYAPDMDAILIKLNSWGTLEVGLSENTLKTDLKVFPNPSSGIINIQIEKEEAVNLSFYNMMGQRMFDIPDFKGGQLMTESLGLTAGVYSLEFEKDGKKQTQKCVIR